MTQTLSLRRAARIRNKLTERLHELRRELRNRHKSINVFDPYPYKILQDACEDYNELYGRFVAVSAVLYGLRARIDSANGSVGIGALLAEKNALEGQKAIVDQIIDTEAMVTHDQLTARIAGSTERAKVADSFHETTTYTIISQATIDSAKMERQKIQSRLDTIQDSLESLNNTTRVELTDSDFSLLTSERLV